MLYQQLQLDCERALRASSETLQEMADNFHLLQSLFCNFVTCHIDHQLKVSRCKMSLTNGQGKNLHGRFHLVTPRAMVLPLTNYSPRWVVVTNKRACKLNLDAIT